MSIGAAAMLLLLTPTSAEWYPPPPRYITYQLGGVDVRTAVTSSEDRYIIDKKRKYCLSISHGPSSQVQLLLTRVKILISTGDLDLKRDRRIITERTIKPMGNERGIHIGDKPSKVLRILGLPTEHDEFADGDPERTGNGMFLFHYPGARLNGWSYEAYYDFKNGRLQAISIAIARAPDVAG